MNTKFSIPVNTRELIELLSYLYLENARPEKAVILLSSLNALDPIDARSLATLALAQLHAGKSSAALLTLDSMAMQGSVDALFHLIRAQTLMALNRREEAHSAMRAYVHARDQTTLQPALNN